MLPWQQQLPLLSHSLALSFTHSTSLHTCLSHFLPSLCVYLPCVLASFCGSRTQQQQLVLILLTLFPSFSFALYPATLSIYLPHVLALCVYPAYCKLFLCCHALECATGSVACHTLLFAWDTGCFLRLISGTNIMIDGSGCYGKNCRQPEEKYIPERKKETERLRQQEWVKKENRVLCIQQAELNRNKQRLWVDVTSSFVSVKSAKEYWEKRDKILL